MTLAAVIESPPGAQADAPAGSIVRVEVVDDLRDAEAVWRSLERSGLCTPYQRFDIQAAWQDHIGAPEGRQPVIAIAYGADDQPLLLLPLVVRRQAGVRIAEFLGGKHITFNMPLWQREFAASASKADMDALVSGISRHAGTADVLALLRQPQSWLGIANPLALLPRHQRQQHQRLLLGVKGDDDERSLALGPADAVLPRRLHVEALIGRRQRGLLEVAPDRLGLMQVVHHIDTCDAGSGLVCAHGRGTFDCCSQGHRAACS